MNASPVPPLLAIGLDDALFSLTGALDLVGVDEIAHGRRVAAVSLACAGVLGWDEERRRDLLRVALLHDCGISTTSAHRWIVESGLAEPGPQAMVHCELGSESFRAFPRLAPLSNVVLNHHTPWVDLPEMPAAHREMANLVLLADRVDVLRLSRRAAHPRAMREDVLSALETRRVRWFAPDFLDTLAEASRPEAFWYGLDDHVVDEVLREARPTPDESALAIEDLRGIARIFARIVDVKSRWTLRHSEGVSKLARGLAEQEGWGPEECEAIEIAGFFHDIGKLRVPDAILEKPGPLEPDERETFKRHAFDTFRILKRMFPDRRIAEWAAYHHEWISGDGYPFGLADGELDDGARFVAVADVAQAFLQKRPYRDALSRADVLARLRAFAMAGQLDVRAVEGLDRLLTGGADSKAQAKEMEPALV